MASKHEVSNKLTERGAGEEESKSQLERLHSGERNGTPIDGGTDARSELKIASPTSLGESRNGGPVSPQYVKPNTFVFGADVDLYWTTDVVNSVIKTYATKQDDYNHDLSQLEKIHKKLL